MSRDDRSWNDGDKLSFSERDRMRREGRASDDRRPRGVSKAKVESATKQYLKRLDAYRSRIPRIESSIRRRSGT